MWPVNDNMPARRGSRARIFLSHAIILPYMTIKYQSNVSKMQSSLQNINKQTMEACCRQYAQAPVVAVYLLWTTFQKGHLTEPVPSGGLWLCRAWGHLHDPTARKGGGKGRGGQGGGGGGSWGGRTSRDKGTVPLAIGAVPRAFIKLGGAISIRKQWPVDS